jgi:iron complex transport system substrate-binding protein
MRVCALRLSALLLGWALVGLASAQPTRVMSLNLCTDVLVLHLAPRERIVSLSHIAANSPLSPIVETARGIPANYASAEEVVAFQPDLVLARRHTAAATVQLARRLGFTVLELDDPRSYDEALAQIRLMANALGETARGEELIAGMNARLAALPPPSAHRPVAVVYGPNGYTFGSGSLLDDLMRRAGFENLAARAGLGAAGTLPLEALLLDPPEVLFIERETRTVTSLADQSLAHPVLRHLAARLPQADLSSRLWNCAGPEIVEAVAQMAAVRQRMALQP